MTAAAVESAGPGSAARIASRRRWAEFVFGPPPTEAKSPALPWITAALLVVGTAIALARTPLSSWGILWAEDGAVFLAGALGGDLQAVLTPYAGYLHLLPRLAILPATLVPIGVAPVVVTVTAAILTAAAACAVFVLLSARMRSLPILLAAWVLVLAAPVAGGEVANNLANLHWLLIVAAFCSVLVRSRSRGFTALQVSTVVAAVASDPLAIALLLPIVLLRLLLLRDRGERALSVAFGVAALLQMAVVAVAILVGEGRDTHTEMPTVVDFLEYYGFRVVMVGALGKTWTMALGAQFGSAGAWTALVLAVSLVLIAVVASRTTRVAVLAFVGASTVFAIVVYASQWYALGPGGPLLLDAGDRYAVVPAMLLMIALLLAADRLAALPRTPWAQSLVGIVVLVAVVAPVVVDFRERDAREGAVAWAETLSDAARECAAGDAVAVRVEIAPPGWSRHMMLPCARVPAAP